MSISNDWDALSPKLAQDSFLNLLENWELSDSVFYHGMVLGEEKQQFLIEANALILPTYYPWEGQPISIIEALAFCTPVIATPHKGIPDQVIDGYNGFLVDKNSPEQIADAVQKLFENPDLYRKLSENARRHFIENFSQETNMANMLSAILGSQC
jgi:glycosyltransferase involved in cell wall biosynthesis